MQRLLRVIIGAALVATIGAPAAALSPSGTVTDWLCADEQEREIAAHTLALIAGQGRSDLEERFFVRCIDDVAYTVMPQTKTIGEIANGCALMTTLTYAESD